MAVWLMPQVAHFWVPHVAPMDPFGNLQGCMPHVPGDMLRVKLVAVWTPLVTRMRWRWSSWMGSGTCGFLRTGFQIQSILLFLFFEMMRVFLGVRKIVLQSAHDAIDTQAAVNVDDMVVA